MGTVHGEDLPYIFGAPLVEGFSHFPRNYTKSELALSEAVMIFWSNFARTGNPNEHHRQDQVLLASKERNRFRSINWEEYDPVHQKYLEIGNAALQTVMRLLRCGRTLLCFAGCVWLWVAEGDADADDWILPRLHCLQRTLDYPNENSGGG